jgi:hypothetical protein
MKKKDNEASNEKAVDSSRNSANVRFLSTYVGDLGIFYKNVSYRLTREQYEALKEDCEEID